MLSKLAVLLALILPATAAAGNVTLRKIQVTDGSRIDLFFDGPVSPERVRTEFFNDIIQVSLSGVSVYPAKISSVSGMDLTKVFAYQYAPKLTRCRLTVKGRAESYEGRFEARAGGKVLTLRIGDGQGAGDRITRSAAKSERPTESTPEEKELLKRVLSSVPGAPGAPARSIAPDAGGAGKPAVTMRAEPLAGGKPLPSPARPLAMLGLVLAILGCIAWIVRKAKGGAALRGHKGLGALMERIPGLSGKNKLIEVVATHHLGPKKSIAVVRIGGRMLVLGVTAESVNLITRLESEDPDASIEQADLDQLVAESIAEKDPGPRSRISAPAGASRFPDPNGSKVYGQAARAAAVSFGAELSQASAQPQSFRDKSGARDRIRSRVEGMKQI